MSSPENEARPRPMASGWLWLVPPTVVGALLRVWGVQRQVLAGDEIHALQFAAENPLGTILTHTSQEVDHCVPLTAFVRLALDAGLRPSELLLRAPVLVSGILLVPLLAQLVRRPLGTSVACAFAWLLAISPMLVLYGRILRSYGPVLLLALAAVLAFHRWLEHGRRGDAVAYVVLAPLAAYFHLVAAVFVAAPLAYALLPLRGRRDGLGWRAIAGVGTAALLVSLALFAPFAASLLGFVAAKSGEGSWRWSTLASTLQLHTGAVEPSVALLFFAVAGLGAVRLARRRPGLCAYLAFLAGAHVAALLVASPAKYSNVLVLNRYLLLLLPILALCAACAFGSDERHGRRALLRNLLLAAFLALLFAAGPLTHWQYLHGSFAHHNRFLAFVNASFDSAPVDHAPSAFDEQLATEADVRAIVEYPVDHRWSHCNAPYYDQRVHGKEVLVSNDLALYADARFGWRNSIAAEPAAWLASRADRLVVHLDPGAEERGLTGESDERTWREVSARARAMRVTLLLRWGEPSFQDERIAVWDLRAVRSAEGAKAPR